MGGTAAAGRVNSASTGCVWVRLYILAAGVFLCLNMHICLHLHTAHVIIEVLVVHLCLDITANGVRACLHASPPPSWRCMLKLVPHPPVLSRQVQTNVWSRKTDARTPHEARDSQTD